MDWYEADPIWSDIQMRLEPQRFYGCIWAETKGKKRLSKKIEFEVCGSEELTTNPPTSESITLDYRAKDQEFSGNAFKQTDITAYKSRVQVKYPLQTNCRITS